MSMIAGLPYQYIHFVNTTLATVSASLFGVAMISAYLVKASVMVSTYLLPMSEVLQRPKRSMWIHWFDILQWATVHCFQKCNVFGGWTFYIFFDMLQNVIIYFQPDVTVHNFSLHFVPHCVQLAGVCGLQVGVLVWMHMVGTGVACHSFFSDDVFLDDCHVWDGFCFLVPVLHWEFVDPFLL